MQKIGTSAVQSRATGGVANGTYLFALPGSSGACKDAWDEILKWQLDYRHRPCNFIEIMPRLDEHLRRQHDHRKRRPGAAELAQHVEPVEARQDEVQQHQVVCTPKRQLEAGVDIGLGTDGPMSSNQMDIINVMAFAAVVSLLARTYVTMVPA